MMMAKALERTVLGRHLWVSLMAKRHSLDLEAIPFIKPEPQMDDAGVENKTPTKTIQKSDVVLEEDAKNEEVATSVPKSQNFAKYSVSESKQQKQIDRFVDRWILVDSYKWMSTQDVGFDLLSGMRLPSFLFKKKKYMNSPNLQMFLLNRYFRGKMKVRILINSNQFQIGSLLMSWQYGSPAEQGFDSYNNIYTASQRQSLVVSAAPGNSGEMDIEYHYPDSVLTLDHIPFLGVLRLQVLNRLTVQPSVSASCDVSLFVSFEDTEFYGSIGRDLGYEVLNPQMETVADLCDTGSRLIRALRPDPNRDNPPSIAQPIQVTPVATASMSYTDHIEEPISVLRGDPSGQTPSLSTESETKIQDLVQKPGLLAIIEWKVENKKDQRLACVPITPLMPTSQYDSTEEKSIVYYNVPPLGVVSSLFGKWRGDIVFDLNIIGSSYHSGRLFIAYLPTPATMAAVGSYTIDQLQNSPYKIVDVRGSTQVSFTVPWYWKNAWGDVRGLSKASTTTGYIYIKVLNELICIDRVPPTVFINLYVRGGKNFELALPRPTCLGAKLHNVLIPPKTDYLKPYSEHIAVYSTWNRLIPRQTGYAMTLYYQNITDGYEAYIDPKIGEYYQLSETTTSGFRLRVTYRTKDNKMPMVRYAVYDPALDGNGYRGILLCGSTASAIAAATAIMAAKTDEDRKIARNNCLEWVEDGQWSTVLENGREVAAENGKHGAMLWTKYSIPMKQEQAPSEIVEPPGEDILTKIHKQTSELLARKHSSVRAMQPTPYATPVYPQPKPQPEMETNSGAVSKVPAPAILVREVPETSMGMVTFGESMVDLKSFMRRWIHHCSITRSVPQSSSPADNVYMFRMPVTPFRRIAPGHSYEYDNRVREGVISLISSGYQFWRGGLRYKIMVTGPMPEGSMLFVQHRYDESVSGSTPMMEFGTKALTTRDLMLTQYATAAQALSVNSVLTIEVPYYSEREKLKIRSDGLDWFSNGKLYVWVHSPMKADISLEMYYSIADDCQFSVFQGFPPMMDINTFKNEPQMEVESQGPIMSTLKIPSSVVSTSNKIGQLADASLDTLQSVKVRVSDLATSITDVSKKVAGKTADTLHTTLHSIVDVGKAVYKIVSHLVYCILSPTKPVIIWALVNIVLEAWGPTADVIDKLTTSLSSLWDRLTSVPEGQIDVISSDCEQITGVLFTLMSSMLSMTMVPPTDMKALVANLFVIGAAARSRTAVASFVKDFFELMRRVWDYIMSSFGSTSENKKIVLGLQDNRLKTWMMESLAITATEVDEMIFEHPEWSEKVFELIVVGRGLQIALADKSTGVSLIPCRNFVNSLMKKLERIETQLIHQRVYSAVRYEPFVLWIGGVAGAGKSAFAEQMGQHLAEQLGRTDVQVCYPRCAGQKYFDGYRNQPCVFQDDFLSASMSTDPEGYTQFLQMKSAVLFNPPYAEADAKDRFINFPNLIISSNCLYFENIPGIHDHDAYNRRRDLLLEFCLRTVVDKNKSIRLQYSGEQLDRLEHVDVFHCQNPMNPRDAKRKLIPRVSGEDYGSVVRKYILAESQRYHERQSQDYQTRSQRLRERVHSIPGNGQPLNVYLEEVKTLLTSEDGSSRFTIALEDWKQRIVNACSLAKPEIRVRQEDEFADCVAPQGEMDDNLTWNPSLESSAHRPGYNYTFDSQTVTIEPLNRKQNGYTEHEGLRECIHAHFDTQSAAFGLGRVAYSVDYEKDSSVKSIPLDVCGYMTHGKFEPNEDCRWMNSTWRYKFLKRMFSNSYHSCSTFIQDEYTNAEDEEYDSPYLPPDCLEFLRACYSTTTEEQAYGLPLNLEYDIDMASKKVVLIGEVVVPKTPGRGIKQVIWNEVLEILGSTWKFLKALIAFVGGLFVVNKLLSWMTPTGQLHPSGDYTTMKSLPKKSSNIRPLKYAVGQMGVSEARSYCEQPEEQIDAIMKKIENNVFFLVGENKTGDHVRMRCLGLFNRKFIIMKHYVDHCEGQEMETVFLVFRLNRLDMELYWSDIKIQWYEDGYGVGELPACVPVMFKNITKYMPSESYQRGFPTECTIMEVNLTSTNVVSVHADYLDTQIMIPRTGAQKPWVITQGFRYPWGGKGKCGSVLLAPKLRTPLIGIHTAGIMGLRGYSEALVRETFIRPEEETIEYIVPEMEESVSVDLEGEFFIEGQLRSQDAVHSSGKTSIRPSTIHGVFPIETEPAPLTSYDPRLERPECPLRVGTARRCSKLLEFPPELISKALIDLRKKILLQARPVRTPGVLSITEAVEGLDIPGYESLNMSTSEGWPWVNLRPGGASNKSWMFEREIRSDGRFSLLGVNEVLYDTLKMKQTLRERGIVPNSPFTCALKDARIPKEKVPVVGKTRVFEICPVDLTIAQRQYFLDFIVSYQTARLSCENTIGINCDGPQWTELAEELRNFSPHILTADYSGYGPRMSSTMLEAAFEIECDWYDHYAVQFEPRLKTDRLVRRVIMHEVAHGPHVYKDILFRPTAGMPSGNPATVQKNSLVNSLYIRVAYLGIMKERRRCYADLYWFSKLVLIFHNGDDLIMAVKPEIIDVFNNVTLIEYFGRFHLKMTDAAKSGVVRTHCTLEEATYLKRGFMKHPSRPGQWLAPLEERSIRDTANWIWKCVDETEASLVNSEMCARLAYTRGKIFYDGIVQNITDAWFSQGRSFSAPSWESLDDHVWEGTPGPVFTSLV